MKNFDSSNEAKLIFILCKLACAQLREGMKSENLKNLLSNQIWKNSSIEEKHELLKNQYEKDFAFATKEQQMQMIKIRKSIEIGLASF